LVARCPPCGHVVSATSPHIIMAGGAGAWCTALASGVELGAGLFAVVRRASSVFTRSGGRSRSISSSGVSCVLRNGLAISPWARVSLATVRQVTWSLFLPVAGAGSRQGCSWSGCDGVRSRIRWQAVSRRAMGWYGIHGPVSSGVATRAGDIDSRAASAGGRRVTGGRAVTVAAMCRGSTRVCGPSPFLVPATRTFMFLRFEPRSQRSVSPFPPPI